MPKTTIEIDPHKAAVARRILGARTLRETVDRALDGVIRRDARLRSIDRLQRRDGLDLDDPRDARGGGAELIARRLSGRWTAS